MSTWTRIRNAVGTIIDPVNSTIARVAGSVGDAIGGGGDSGSGGDSGGGGGGYPKSVVPADISSLFPKASLIDSAPYKFTDPLKYAAKFGTVNRGQLAKNSKFSKNLALDNLDTELQGLKAFAPAASALKMQLIAQDNVFNQDQRTAQINSAIPDVLKDLDQQAADARIYARGEVPNSIVDKGLELGLRSQAADQSGVGGFGVRSSAARSISDLLDAKTRIGLSQYGNQLLASTDQTQANLRLAPTEYNNAGSQISATPSISGSQLQQANFNQVNQNTLINPNTALQSVINQNQFVTSNENATRQFNAGNLNNFALSLFNYKAGLANAVAGAANTDINTSIGLDQQALAREAANKARNDAQKANAVSSGIQSIFGIAGGLFGL